MTQAAPALLETTTGIPGTTMKVLYDQQVIQKRVAELAARISQDYKDCDLVLVAILKGAQIFACDLIRKLNIPASLEFMSISRYKRSEETTGVRITRDLEMDLYQKDVLVVEDIVDTGLTLNFLTEKLKQRSPASINICTLLDRPELRLADIPVRYSGFHIAEQFLVGYGLDYREKYRNLPFIAAIEK